MRELAKRSLQRTSAGQRDRGHQKGRLVPSRNEGWINNVSTLKGTSQTMRLFNSRSEVSVPTINAQDLSTRATSEEMTKEKKVAMAPSRIGPFVAIYTACQPSRHE